jgi:hypothetical protein
MYTYVCPKIFKHPQPFFQILLSTGFSMSNITRGEGGTKIRGDWIEYILYLLFITICVGGIYAPCNMRKFLPSVNKHFYSMDFHSSIWIPMHMYHEELGIRYPLVFPFWIPWFGKDLWFQPFESNTFIVCIQMLCIYKAHVRLRPMFVVLNVGYFFPFLSFFFFFVLVLFGLIFVWFCFVIFFFFFFF